MQLLLSGALAGRAHASASECDSDTAREAWNCHLCGAKNGSTVDDESDRDQCPHCSRRRHPVWLLIENANLQLQLGSHVQLLDDANFGTKIGVVTGIDFYKRRIQVLAVSSKAAHCNSNVTSQNESHREIKSASGRRSRSRFELCELDVSQLQQLQRIQLDHEASKNLLVVVKQHGLCGDCRRVFRIAQGESNERESSCESIQALQRELRKCIERKTQNIKLKDYDRVLECTSRIKTMNMKLLLLRRKVEFIEHLSCPHCGWRAEREEQSK